MPAVLAVAATLTAAQAADPVQLITREEAGLPTAAKAVASTRNLTRGPGIDTLPTPEGRRRQALPPCRALHAEQRRAHRPRHRAGLLPSPAPGGHHRADRPFITPAEIDAPSVIVPSGSHVIEIEATDKEGRIGRRQITLTVDPPR